MNEAERIAAEQEATNAYRTYLNTPVYTNARQKAWDAYFAIEHKIRLQGMNVIRIEEERRVSVFDPNGPYTV